MKKRLNHAFTQTHTITLFLPVEQWREAERIFKKADVWIYERFERLKPSRGIVEELRLVVIHPCGTACESP
jgi:hypothetical protein